MDELERRLKTDADRITVSATDELQKRIDASLAAERERRPVAVAAPPPARASWWVPGLTGLALAAAVIAALNWTAGDRQVNSDNSAQFANSEFSDTPSVDEVSLDDLNLPAVVDWRASGAELTGPLEDELENLQSDFERARRNVERDLGL